MNNLPNPYANPFLFLSMFTITILVVGILLYREFDAWYLRFKLRQRAEILNENPRALRQKNKDLQTIVDSQNAEIEKLHRKLAQLSEMEREVKILNDRNKFLSNEVRYNPGAKTEVFTHGSSGRRWKYLADNEE